MKTGPKKAKVTGKEKTMTDLVTINLDKTRNLRLTLKGMIEFQKLTGKNLMEGFNIKTIALEDVAALVWASLIHEDEDLKYEDVLNMLDLSNITAAMEAMTACILQSLPEIEKIAEGN